MTLETKKGANQGEFSVGYQKEHESFQDALPHFPPLQMIVKKQSPSPVLHLMHLYVLGLHHHLLILWSTRPPPPSGLKVI